MYVAVITDLLPSAVCNITSLQGENTSTSVIGTNKKTRPAGVRQPPGFALRRRPLK
jgi:hypothetical protein